MTKIPVKMTVNGAEIEVLAEPRVLLIHVLREELGLTGSHIGCDTGHCGACTVDLNGKSVKSCTMFVAQADGAEIITIGIHITGVGPSASRRVVDFAGRQFIISCHRTTRHQNLTIR